MRKKRIIKILLVVSIIGSCFLGYKIYVKGDSRKVIKEEAACKILNSSDDSKDRYKTKDDEAEEYKELSKQVLKRYFDIQNNELDELTSRVSRVNENIITDIQSDIKKNLEESYADNKISQSEYEEEMESCDGGPNDQYEAFKKNLKHNIISITWRNENKCYCTSFNEKTNEIDNVICFNFNEEGVKLNITSEEVKKTADKFIVDRNLEISDKLNFECVEELEEKSICGRKSRSFWKVNYSYKNDSNKRLSLEINMYTGKVQSFYFE